MAPQHTHYTLFPSDEKKHSRSRPVHPLEHEHEHVDCTSGHARPSASSAHASDDNDATSAPRKTRNVIKRLNLYNMSSTSPLRSSKPDRHPTGLRPRQHSRFAYTTKPLSTPTPRQPHEHLSPAPTTRGLRCPGDSKDAPSTSHMKRRAKHLERSLARKPVPTMVGTLSPATLAALAIDKDVPVRAVRRKAVPPRPSGPTLLETTEEFENPPRAPPPTPVGSSTVSPNDVVARVAAMFPEVRSSWDSDGGSEEEEGDEKMGLVGRVRSLTLNKRKGSVGSEVGLVGGKRRSGKGRGRGSGKGWKGVVLCGCREG